MTRKAGAIAIDALRRRILLGRYFGRWSPGDRLPSVREVAELEGVDRKTAAAAYRQLQTEGLVRVEPRSGVYLEREQSPEPGNPLARLHGQWLEGALASAEDLGLDTDAILRLFHAVAAVQKRRIPVIDPDSDHATNLARELSRRTALDCVATRPDDVPDSGPARDAPFLLATPAGVEAMSVVARRIPTVLISLAGELLEDLLDAARQGPVRVVVGSRALERDLRMILDADGDGLSGRVVIDQGTRSDPQPPDDRRVIRWPGTTPPDATSPQRSQRTRRLIADSTLARIRTQIARTALAQLSTSTAAATQRTAGAEPRPR